ncbi:MAG: Fis family transcriptional regulator [Candidatus Parcubacteria bacterium]|nr:MAG: Fis family transcriptional regulator [Candidatus Parcubacteria bacterium]
MLSRVYSAILDGLSGNIIEIETGIMVGLNNFSIIGLTDKAIQESKERINLALKSINAKPPLKFNRRIVINLAPADLKKEGSYLDLGITISFLIATEQIKNPDKKILFLGELGLDGSLKRIRGALPIILSLYNQFEEIYLPEENINEIKFLENIDNIYLFKNLKEVINHLEKTKIKERFVANKFSELYNNRNEHSLESIKISEFILRALLISASGNHNLLLFGPPGTGKTLIAKNLVNLLPDLDYKESLEVSSIYSAYGYNIDNLIIRPPFRNPHHTASTVAIIGGGHPIRPGEITLSHRGVLFLDELPEFKRDALESLREPLDNGEINITRAKNKIRFPAKFLLVSACNPCPCGFYSDKLKECHCSITEIKKYQKKISGPILDRIDMKINVPRLTSEEIFNNSELDVKNIINKIKELKERQIKRQNKYNSELSPKEIKKYCRLTQQAENLLKNSIDKLYLSARGIHKIIKIAKTIADLDNKDIIDENHIAEAIQYRLTDFNNND